MDIYLDTANASDIRKWLAMGLVDGITTNPSIMLRDGFYDLEAGAKELANLIKPRPISVEVTSDVPDEMLRQARLISKWAPNIVIKIPQLTRDGTPCYAVMRKLEEEGIPVNATLVMNFGQTMLSAKAGASYISIFVGRIGDEGGDATAVTRDSVNWLRLWGYKSKVIAASIRSVPDFNLSATAGAHIITTPPNFLQVMTDNKCTREGVRRFIADAESALAKMKKPS
jgi:transaldolase